VTAATGQTVLIIGASRGLGYALAAEYLARGWQVTATVRGTGRTALHDVAESSAGQLVVEIVDITFPEQVAALHERLAQQTFDLLFVNAGVTNGPEETVADVATDTFVRLMVTNALSPMRVVETLQDLVPPNGTIAVMSSGQGSVANNDTGGFEIYRASKSALNQLMRSYAARHVGDPRTLLLMAPGWVQTDLGGPGARLTIGQSIPGVVDTIEAQAGQGGLQYLDYQGNTVPW
jgi:NAD(P)-dependent dehydrogenase (short-subunit alcohol dehydrogenase family)